MTNRPESLQPVPSKIHFIYISGRGRRAENSKGIMKNSIKKKKKMSLKILSETVKWQSLCKLQKIIYLRVRKK